MITTLKRADGRPGFVALHLCPRTRAGKLWRPIRTEGAISEGSAIDAARLCIAALQTQVQPLVGLARELHRNCEPTVERFDTEAHARRIAISCRLSRDLARTWGNLSRLLDEPTAADIVTLDVHAAPLPPRKTEEASDDEYSRDSAPTLTAHQLRAGRTLARLGTRQMASFAGLSTTTVSQIERGLTQTPQESTQEVLRGALEERGIEFAPGGWVRHVGDALATQNLPSDCQRCAQARYLLDIANRVIGQTRVILHESEGIS